MLDYIRWDLWKLWKNFQLQNLIKLLTNQGQSKHAGKKIDAATVKIRSIRKKYKIDFQDIDLDIITGIGSKVAQKSAPTRQNLSVRVAPRKKNITTQIAWQPELGVAGHQHRFRAFARMQAIILMGLKKMAAFAVELWKSKLGAAPIQSRRWPLTAGQILATSSNAPQIVNNAAYP